MANSQVSILTQQLRHAVLGRDEASLTDGELLECFIEGREEAAFTALLHRHGRMVWGVCRRVLRSHQDAEDAFQATFLVLLRRAHSIKPREMVANWLYGVAHQTARKARAVAAIRGGREKQMTDSPEPATQAKNLWHDLQSLLDQELSRLPHQYRILIVLCDLEGKTRKKVAEQLGCPEGTVAGRLARARALLAKRLAKHGLAVSSVTLAAVLSEQAAACVPISVMTCTKKAMALLVAGQTATGAISAKVAVLTEGVLKAMLLKKFKIATAVLAAICVIGAGVGVGGFDNHPPRPEEPAIPQGRSSPEPKQVTLRDDAQLLKLIWSSEGETVTTVGITYDTDKGDLMPISHIKLWDAKTGKLNRSLAKEHNTLIRAIAFAPNGKTAAIAVAKGGNLQPPLRFLQPLAVAGETNFEVRILDTKTWKLQGSVSESRPVYAIAFSPDSQRLAFGGDDPISNDCFVRIWAVGDMQELKFSGQFSPGCLAFSRDGTSLAAGDRNGKIHVLDGQTGESKAVLDACSRMLSKIAFSPDGKTLISGSFVDKDIKLWNVSTGKLLLRLEGNKAPAFEVAFSPNGKLIATAGAMREHDKLVTEIILWDAMTGQLNQYLPDLGKSVSSLAFSPDGKTLAIVRGDLLDDKGSTCGELKFLTIQP